VRGFYRGTCVASQATRRRSFGVKKLEDYTRHRALKLYNARRKPDNNLSAGARLRIRLAAMIPKSDRRTVPVRVCGAVSLQRRRAQSPGRTPAPGPRHFDSTSEI
jgi:hypothetical protein